jgi:hypothetical protein
MLNGHYRVNLPTPLDRQPGGYILAGLDSATDSNVIKFLGNAKFSKLLISNSWCGHHPSNRLSFHRASTSHVL